MADPLPSTPALAEASSLTLGDPKVEVPVNDADKTKEELIAELAQVRRQQALEQALDKVRAEVALMQQSGDISRVAEVLDSQLRSLVNCQSVSLKLVDEAGQTIRGYGPGFLEIFGGEGDYVAISITMDPRAQEYYRAWKEKTVLLTHGNLDYLQSLVREGSEDFIRFLANHEIKRRLAAAKDLGEGLPSEDLRAYFLDDLAGEPLEHLRSMLLAYVSDSATFSETWYADVPFSDGFVGTCRSQGPFSDQELDLLQRATQVFEQAYRRHLDFQRLEQQAQQLRLERAAEKVRAEAIAMRSSRDMARVAAVLWRQMRELGIDTPGASVILTGEKHQLDYTYNAMTNVKRFGLTWTVTNTETDPLVEVDGDTMVWCVSRDVLSSPIAQEVKAVWETGQVQLSSSVFSRETVLEYFRGWGIEEGLDRTEAGTEWVGEWTVVRAPFAHGVVGYREKTHDPAHIEILRSLAGSLSLGYHRFLDFQRVEQAQQQLIAELEGELQTAHNLQMGLMPKSPPHIPGLDIAGQCMPANHVGGDFFQYFQQDGTLSLCLADVTGHAMEAAVPGLMFSGVLKSQVELGEPLDLLFQRLNRTLHSTLDARTFVCFAMGQYDPATGVFLLANAGCPYPYHYRAATNTLEELRVEAYPLGVRPEGSYTVLQTSLAPGDSVVFCSDGVIEATNSAGQMFGFERTAEVVRSGCQQGLSAEGLLERIMEEVKGFRGEVAQGDDQTVVVLRVVSA